LTHPRKLNQGTVTIAGLVEAVLWTAVGDEEELGVGADALNSAALQRRYSSGEVCRKREVGRNPEIENFDCSSTSLGIGNHFIGQSKPLDASISTSNAPTSLAAFEAQLLPRDLEVTF
jgi:hypothetical protein